jgi:hypothetical protein
MYRFLLVEHVVVRQPPPGSQAVAVPDGVVMKLSGTQ